jgi:transposase-like protein
MNIIDVFNGFQTQEQAIEYLEELRWGGHPVCPYCASEATGRHASGDRAATRWQCRTCSRAFASTVGTIFHGTHVPLRNWFLCIALMLNAKKSASAYQIARDLGMRRPTVWSMMHRVRVAMANDPQQAKLLHGIVEADETYVGGKPRRENRHDSDTPAPYNKRGRGTSKTPVIGLMERGGRVIARPAKPGELGTKALIKFVAQFVDTAGTVLITDEWSGYNRVKETFLHATVNHAVEYANGLIHTNNIEGFCCACKTCMVWPASPLQHHVHEAVYRGSFLQVQPSWRGL